MEPIKIVFLGTGSAIPTISRNHTSIFLKYKERNFLIDCGEGTQRQIRKAKLNPGKITDILITHFHGDHVFGLPGLLNTLSKSNYKKTLNIYGPKGSKKMFKKIWDITQVNINVKFKEVAGRFIDNPYFQITAISLEHKIPCNGYLFEEKDRLRIDKGKLSKFKVKGPKLAKLLGKKNIKINGKVLKWKDLTYLVKGRKVSFILDTKICNNAKKLAKNCDLAIIESSFLGDKVREAKKYKHLTLDQAVSIAKSSNVKELILTHFSQRYEFKEKMLFDKAKKLFKNVRIAKDLMALEV